MISADIQDQHGENSLLIAVYDQGSFLTSHKFTLLTHHHHEKLILEQEILDKSKIRKVANCQNYQISEDDCLYHCLVQKFISEFGCLHSRLKRLYIRNATLLQTRVCLWRDLEAPTMEKVSQKPTEEYGLVRIRQLLAGFFRPHQRCDCPVK